MMNKKIQLIFLPYAGGSLFSFMKVIRYLDPRIEAITIEYSGRGSQKNEPIIEEYDLFLLDVVSKIKKIRNDLLQFAILGYSMGSALAFDICSQNLLGEQPIYAFFCAEGSLFADIQARKYALLSDKEFVERICQLGGLDERILKNKPIFDSYLNLIKADYNILGQYMYTSGKVECDSAIIYSSNDPTCVNMQDWSKIITGNIEFYQIGNNHFFLNQEFEAIANIINNKLLH